MSMNHASPTTVPFCGGSSASSSGSDCISTRRRFRPPLGWGCGSAPRFRGGSSVKISVFGLGYVGCVSAACLARDGHTVVGVDINPLKVELVERGSSPVVEPGLNELVASGVAEGRLRVARVPAEAVHDTEVTMITVGTPSNRNSSIHLGHLENTCRE